MTPNTIDKNAQISFDAQFIFKFLKSFPKMPLFSYFIQNRSHRSSVLLVMFLNSI